MRTERSEEVDVLLVVLVLVVWCACCLRVARWRSTQKDRPGPPVAVLPVGHRPPPGLGPLSPSERFLTTESQRGVRELQSFLADRAA